MSRKLILKQIITEKPSAVLVKNKYRVLAGMTKRMFPKLENFTQEELADICFEIIAGDRDWRFLTEGKDKEKIIYEQKWIIKNLM